MAKIVLVDISSVHRKNWRATEHKPTSEAYNTTLREVRDWCADADHAAVCIDSPPYLRKQMYPDYKAGRDEAPPEVFAQLDAVLDKLQEEGYPILGSPGHEADDVIATCVRHLRGHEIVIVSTDKDLLPLVSETVSVLSPATGTVMREADVVQRFGVTPAQIPDWKTLVGDASDNIPGCPKVGDKRATEFLQKHGDLRGVLGAVGSYTDAINRALAENEKHLLTARELIRLRDDVETDVGAILRSAPPAAPATPPPDEGPEARPGGGDETEGAPENGGRRLSDRMARVMAGIKRLKKTGFNQHHRYHFASDADVSDLVRELLAREGVEFNAELTEILGTGELGKQRLVTCRFVMHFRAGDEHRALSWIAEAADTSDKAINKCATAAVKYFLLKNFVISTGDDPDADSPTDDRHEQRDDRQQQGGGYQGRGNGGQSQGWRGQQRQHQ